MAVEETGAEVAAGTLGALGVVAEAAGQLFDPHLHPAMTTDSRAGVPDAAVVAVLREGYRQRGRVLRYAEVSVNQAADAHSAPATDNTICGPDPAPRGDHLQQAGPLEGTTNSVLAVIQDGLPVLLPVNGERLLPSVVGIAPSGEVVVGTPARNQWVVAPERTVRSIKRKIGKAETVGMAGQTYTPQ